MERIESTRAIPSSLGGGINDVYSCDTQNTSPYEVHLLSIYEPPGTVRGGGSPPTAVGDVLVSMYNKTLTKNVISHFLLTDLFNLQFGILGPTWQTLPPSLIQSLSL